MNTEREIHHFISEHTIINMNSMIDSIIYLCSSLIRQFLGHDEEEVIFAFETF